MLILDKFIQMAIIKNNKNSNKLKLYRNKYKTYK
jgi:hypothetical protein